MRIISDGTCNGTVLLTDDNKVVSGVQSISWVADAESNNTVCLIRLIGVKIDVIGKVESPVFISRDNNDVALDNVVKFSDYFKDTESL